MKIGRIGRHLADKSDVKVTMCFGPMPPDASDFPGGIPAFDVLFNLDSPFGLWIRRF